MTITHERTNRIFFELGLENDVIKTSLNKKELQNKYNISVSLDSNKLTIKRTKQVRGNLSHEITYFTKNIKDAVLSKVDDIDLLDENDNNIEVEISLNTDEVILFQFDNRRNERIIIDLV